MSQLATESHENLDVSVSGDVLTYLYDPDAIAPKTVLCIVNLGSDDAPIAGNGPYTLRADINGFRISPDSSVNVGAGVTKTRLQSRELALMPGDEITVSVVGLGGDTAIDTLATLVDMTPLTKAEVHGSGAVPVDQNYGGTDKYTYRTAEGAGIDNAQIQAFLQEDYDAGNRSAAFVRGETQTKADGRWKTPLMLDPGTYVLVFFKQRAYGPDIASLTVL